MYFGAEQEANPTSATTRMILLCMVIGFCGFPWAKNTGEESLLKVPEELELAKHKTIKQEKHIVHRKYQNIVNDTSPKRNRAIEEPVEEWAL